MYFELDNQLWELQRACNRYKAIDCLADWVYFAVLRHIDTGRATTAFCQAFVDYPAEKFMGMIKASLNSDLSDDGIMKTVKRLLHQ